MSEITSKEDFMAFFRDNEKLNTLPVGDRIEIFCTVLLGSSDITYDLLNNLLIDYNVDNLKIVHND